MLLIEIDVPPHSLRRTRHGWGWTRLLRRPKQKAGSTAGRIDGVVLSLLYLAFRALLGALARSRRVGEIVPSGAVCGLNPLTNINLP